MGKNFDVLFSKLLLGKGRVLHKLNAIVGRRGNEVILALLSDL